MKDTGGHKIVPKWMINSVPINSDLLSEEHPITSVPLHVDIEMCLLKEGIEHFFPVQWAVINQVLRINKCPPSLPRRDICVCCPTGSGKTLAYVIPIVQTLQPLKCFRKLFALIVVPVQELAVQVGKVFKLFTKRLGLRILYLAGSTKLSFEEAKEKLIYRSINGNLYMNCHILITTPGNLVSQLSKNELFDLTDLKFMVIDEADRVIENPLHNWITRLDHNLNSAEKISLYPLNIKKNVNRPQKLLFSATLTQDPEKLRDINLFKPLFFTTKTENNNKYVIPEGLNEHYIVADPLTKPLILNYLIKINCEGVLCFTNSAKDAHRLVKVLSFINSKKKVKELSNSFTIHQRDSILTELSQGRIDMVISSNRLARGIDVPSISCVICYDPPKNLRTYIHRAGRTGRAGRSGTVITMVSNQQLKPFQNLFNDPNSCRVKQMKMERELSKSDLQNYKKALARLKIDTEKEFSTMKNKMKQKKNKHFLKFKKCKEKQ